MSLTNNDIDDASILEPLLEQIPLPIAKVAADGVYDRQKVYDSPQKRQIQALIFIKHDSSEHYCCFYRQ
jgi:hypothetical protein